HRTRLVSGTRYMAVRGATGSGGGTSFTRCGKVADVMIDTSFGEKRKGTGATGRSLRRASRPDAQVERGDEGDSDHRDLDQQDAERRQVETRRDGRHERLRAHHGVVDDRLARRTEERGPYREALEDRAAAAHGESGPTLDLEPHPLLDAVHRHGR